MKEKKDKLHSIWDHDEIEMIVPIPENHKITQTRQFLEQTFPEGLCTVFVECSKCGHIHNIKKPCKCGKMTDVYVD